MQPGGQDLNHYYSYCRIQSASCEGLEGFGASCEGFGGGSP